jgi:hypothetical protein
LLTKTVIFEIYLEGKNKFASLQALKIKKIKLNLVEDLPNFKEDYSL